MELRITICDADGSVITDDVLEAATASDTEIAHMVQMIESGTPAYLAAILAMKHAKLEKEHAT